MSGPRTSRRPSVRPRPATKPLLVFFHSPRSGRCKRVDGFLAQVLQRGHNHDSFRICRVDADARPDLIERFRIAELPTLVVIDDGAVCSRLAAPRGCREIADLLAPWLEHGRRGRRGH